MFNELISQGFETPENKAWTPLLNKFLGSKPELLRTLKGHFEQPHRTPVGPCSLEDPLQEILKP